MNDSLLNPLCECAREIGEAVKAHRGRGLSGDRATQYHLDVVADDVARRVLGGAGFRVVSEESGVSGEGEFTVVVDPIDGSTNCDRGVPFYATSLAVVRDDELVAALVMNQATGTVFEAEKGSRSPRVGKRRSPRRSSDPRAIRHAISVGIKIDHWGQRAWRFVSWRMGPSTCTASPNIRD